MIYIFIINGGSAVAQYSANSQKGMDMWSLWFDLWPWLLGGAAIAVLGNLIWSIISIIKSKKEWLPIAISGIVISALAFFTVGANFPDA